jgi:hypothetical protein
VTESSLPPPLLPEAAIDGVASVLFAGFVGVLFLGYLDPGFPYSSLATLPLVGSLVTLFWANLRVDRRARSAPAALSP